MTEQPLTTETPSIPKKTSKTGIVITLLALIIFVAAFGYGYFQLGKVNVALARDVSTLKQQAAEKDKTLDLIQKSMSSLQNTEQQSQDMAAQQEQVIANWRDAQKGDLNKWSVAEAKYLVQLANDHLQFTHDINLAMLLIQRADDVLQNVQDPNLLEIRKSLAADLAKLQAVPQVNVTELYLRLSGLNTQIDQLPFPATPLAAQKTTPEAIPADTSWWKKGLMHTWETLRQIVIVRNNNTKALPLVVPDEKIYLNQNLHAQMESAMWGVLHRNDEVYQDSLARAINWIKQYYVPDAPETKAMLDNLQDLQKVEVQPPQLNLADTLQQFESVSASTSSTSTSTETDTTKPTDTTSNSTPG
jgi:uroporphyrin-3 C-methyltransferase